jgi:hypothetical protein
MNMSEKTEQKPKYQESPGGFFAKGNPGKPVGAKHMTTKLWEAITRVSEGSEVSDDVAIVRTLVEKAKGGDMRGIELVLGYIDGKPKQDVGLSGAGEDGKIEIVIRHV